MVQESSVDGEASDGPGFVVQAQNWGSCPEVTGKLPEMRGGRNMVGFVF